jgi:hypothetical protein
MVKSFFIKYENSDNHFKKLRNVGSATLRYDIRFSNDLLPQGIHRLFYASRPALQTVALDKATAIKVPVVPLAPRPHSGISYG